MSIADQINSDIKEAMKAKDRDKLDALRAIKSALIMEATKSADSTVDDELATKVMAKLLKQRMDAAEIYKTQDREDHYADEISQADVIKAYLPEPMAEAEVEEIVKKIIADTSASSMADMGKVMGMASAAVNGRADGKLISTMVRKALQ